MEFYKGKELLVLGGVIAAAGSLACAGDLNRRMELKNQRQAEIKILDAEKHFVEDLMQIFRNINHVRTYDS